MLRLTELNEDYCGRVGREKERHALTAKAEIDYMNHSTARYHGRHVRTLYVPKMFTPEDVSIFGDLIRTLYGIFDKVIERYRRDASYRRLFGFSGELEELILREPAYPCKIPIARIDIFYNEETKDFKFCEFNTDGSSAMNEDRELVNGLKLTLGYEQLAEQYQVGSFELFDSWVEESLDIYRGTEDAADKPYVAIVDFMENATGTEFEIFAESYRRHGLECEICEIRNLHFRGGRLYGAAGKPIDLIYRRAVTSDIMSHYGEVQDFIAAVREGKVCLIGDFTTQIVHNKVLYQVLHHPATRGLLTEEENDFVKAHVPYTVAMEEEYLPYGEIVSQKDRFILKPKDSYGSKGVFAGVEQPSGAEWRKTVDACRRGDYLVQEFCTPYRTRNIDFSQGVEADFIQVSNLTGLFVYGGKFRGIYSRVSRGPVISTQYSELALPSILVEPRGN